MEVSISAVEPLWEEAFGAEPRPELYASTMQDEDGFLPLNDPQDFVTDITHMSNQQLYAASANNQLAMKMAQDEFMQISKLIMDLNGKDSVKDPQAMKKPEVFEEMKESRLYGYKYEKNKPALLNRSEDDITDREREDVRLFQEPFEQGGFVPTDRQYKAKLQAARDLRNPDGFVPIERNGRLLIPRQQIPRPEYDQQRPVAFRQDKEFARPGTASSVDSAMTPSKPANRQLVRTRFNGTKVPNTRDASEDPSGISTPNRGRRMHTPKLNGNSLASSSRHDDSPATKRRRLNPGAQSRPGQSVFRRHQPPTHNSLVSNDSAVPDVLSQGLSPRSLRQRKWTTEELVEAVKADHSWLNDDPIQAEHWKEKILNSLYPVRTFSMFKKWSYWKQEKRDKRPRNRKTDNSTDRPGIVRGESVEPSNETDEVKRVVEEELGEMMLEAGVGEKGEIIDEATNGDDPEEIGPSAEGVRLELAQDNQETEQDFEAERDAAMEQQIVEELQPSIEESDEVSKESSPENPEDTIIAKAGDGPVIPRDGKALSSKGTQRMLRSTRR